MPFETPVPVPSDRPNRADRRKKPGSNAPVHERPPARPPVIDLPFNRSSRHRGNR
jgi:hypothetical protein